MTADDKALLAALGATAADLDANRRGLLSRGQIERLKSIRQRNTLVAASLFILMTLGATLLVFLGQTSQSTILSGAGAMLIALNAIMIGIAGRAFMRVGGDLRAGSVESLAGEVERVLRRGRVGDNYLLRVNGVDLAVSKEIFKRFRHKARYCIYRAGFSRVLLAAERDDESATAWGEASVAALAEER